MTLQETQQARNELDREDKESTTHSKPEDEESSTPQTGQAVVQSSSPHDNDIMEEEKQGEPSNEDNVETDEHHAYRRSCIIKFIVGMLLLGVVIFVIIDSLTTGHLKTGLENFLQWMQDNVLAGAVVFIFVYFAATVLFIPGTILTLGAGFVFARVAHNNIWGGVILGALVVFIGASLGAIVSFLLGRFLLREAVINKLARKYSTFQALERALQQQGFKIFLLLRLSPVIPFNAINYIGGVTSVSLKHYVMALIGILPGTTLYVFLGASAESLASAGDSSSKTVTIIVVVVGSVFGILALWLTTRYARKELNRVLEEQRQEQAEAAAAAASATLLVLDGQDDVVTSTNSNNSSPPTREQRPQGDAQAEPGSTDTFDV